MIGGGNSAGQAALHLAQHAGTVTLLVRGSSLKSTLSNYLVERIDSSPNIRVLTDCTLESLDGEAALERISYRNSRTNETSSAATSWVVVCIGGEPRTDWDSQGVLQLDSAGYILTGPDVDVTPNVKAPWRLRRPPLFLETSLDCVFTAGDIRHGSIKRCATAVGEGATAVSMVHQYLAELK